jgi:hypothetical protein
MSKRSDGPETLSDLRCQCGSGDIFALRPGQEAEYGVARDLLGDPDQRLPPILIRGPEPDTAWCRACHPMMLGKTA